MKKRGIVCLVLSLTFGLSALALGGCNVANNDPNSDKPQIDIENNTEASVFLTVGTLANSNEKALMQKWINKYQQLHKEVSIKISKTYSAMSDLINYQSAGTLPDICWTAGDQHAEFSDPKNIGGYFQDLSDESKFAGSETFFDGFYDEIIETTHYNSKDTGIWFVPRDYNRLVIYYNASIFQDKNIPLPENGWTWTEFVQTCDALVAAGCTNAIEWRNWAPVHSTMVKNFGASYVDADGYFAFEGDNAQAVYNWYREWVGGNRAIIGEGGAFSSYNPQTSAEHPRAAMLVDTYAKLGSYVGAATKNGWICNAVSFPNYEQADGSDGYVGAGCSGYAITKACSDETERKWAWDFLKWCMSREGYDEVADLGVVCPALKSMSDSGKWTTYEVNGFAIDYSAFVDKSTHDLGLNYQNVLDSTSDQGQLISCALTMWNSAPSVEFATASSTFKKSYESATGKRK